jgi:hypothetical protein
MITEIKNLSKQISQSLLEATDFAIAISPWLLTVLFLFYPDFTCRLISKIYKNVSDQVKKLLDKTKSAVKKIRVNVIVISLTYTIITGIFIYSGIDSESKTIFVIGVVLLLMPMFVFGISLKHFGKVLKKRLEQKDNNILIIIGEFLIGLGILIALTALEWLLLGSAKYFKFVALFYLAVAFQGAATQTKSPAIWQSLTRLAYFCLGLTLSGLLYWYLYQEYEPLQRFTDSHVGWFRSINKLSSAVRDDKAIVNDVLTDNEVTTPTRVAKFEVQTYDWTVKKFIVPAGMKVKIILSAGFRRDAYDQQWVNILYEGQTAWAPATSFRAVDGRDDL